MVGRTGRVVRVADGRSRWCSAAARRQPRARGSGAAASARLHRGRRRGDADPRDRGRASSTSRWSSSGRTTTAAGARPTTRACSTCASNVANSHVAYIENVPEGADSEQIFRTLARKGFNLIIGTSFGYMDPMATVAEEFPEPDVPPPHRLQVERQELRQPLRRDRGHEVPRRHAGRVARARSTATRSSATWPPSRSPRSSAWATRSCAASRDLPRVHDGRRVHQHLARPGQGEGGRDRAVRRRRAGRLHRRRHAAVADVAQEKGKWGVTYDYPASCKVEPASPPRTGSGAPSTPGSPSAVKAKTYKAGYEYFDADTGGHGPATASWTARRRARASRDLPAADVSRSRTRWPRCWPGEFTASTSSPGRSRTTPARSSSPDGREARAVRPRPVPARSPGQRVQDLHVLVGRGHRRPSCPARQLGASIAMPEGAGAMREAPVRH